MRCSRIVGFFILFVGHQLMAQSIQSSGLGSGLWSDPASWTPNIVPTNANSTSITINGGHSIQVDADFTIDQLTVGGTLLVNATRTLTIANGPGTDLTITTGSLQVSGTVVGANGWTFSGLSAANTSFLGGSVYTHLYSTTEGALPLASWAATSTVEIRGFTSSITATPAGNWGQTFGNFVYHCASQSYYSNTNLAGLLTSVAGNLTISRLGGGATEGRLYFFNGESGTLSVGGDMSVGIARVQLSTSGNVTVNVGGSFSFNSANSAGSFLNGGGTAVLDIEGNFTMNAGSSGKLNMAGATVRVGGNWQIVNGSFFGPGNLQFDGTYDGITPQSYSVAGTLSGTINFTISASSALSILGENSLEGNGSFTLSGTLILGSTDPMGAMVANTLNGNVQTPVSTRTFNNGSTITYGGLAAQFIGAGHPSSSGIATVIDNASGVTLVNPVTIGGNLELRTGSLNVAGQTLTLNSTSSGSGSIVTTTSSNVSVGGTGNLTIPFATNSSLRNLTINRPGVPVAIGTQVAINNQLNLTSGDLNFSNQHLILNGTDNLLSITAGRLRCNGNSTLTINGSGLLGSALQFQAGANTLGSLVINRVPSGSITLGNSLTISATFDLQKGVFNNPSNRLTMANNSTFLRSGGSQITNSAPSVTPGNRYNLVYPSGGVNSGLEMPSDPTVLNNLTVSGGSLTLAQSLTVNGNFLLSSGSVTTGNFSITMNGSTWTQTGGSLGAGLGVGSVVFPVTTTITGSVPVNFGYVQFGSSSVITMPSTLNVSNHFTVQSGATINTNNGTVLFSGSGNQLLSGGGTTLLNITVNKSGGTLSINTPVNLLGVLSIQSSSTVNANGNLTLLSLTDGPSNNGSIGPLPSGASVNGNVTLQRYMSDEGRLNRYIAFPMTGIPVSQLQDDYSVTGSFAGTSYPCTGCLNNNKSIRFYDETLPGSSANGYRNFPNASNTETFTVGRGYLAYMWEASPDNPKVVNQDITGPIVQGDFTYDPAILTFTSTGGGIANDGWNLLGNPYPSSIRWEDLTDLPGAWPITTNIDPTIFVTDNAASVFRSYNRVTNVGDLTNGIIAAGQAFWLKANAPGPAITITELAKTSSTGTFYRRRNAVAKHLVLSLTNNGITDNSFLVLHDNATDDFDQDLDAFKFQPKLPELTGPEFDISILDDYKRAMVMYTVRELHNDVRIPLSIRSVEGGEFTISFSNLDGFPYANTLYLVDAYRNSSTRVTSGLSYSLKLEPNSEVSDRFYLALTNEIQFGESDLVDVVITPNPVKDWAKVITYTKVLPEVTLVDALGRTVGQINMDNNEGYGFVGDIDMSSQPRGLYIVKVRVGRKVITERVLRE